MRVYLDENEIAVSRPTFAAAVAEVRQLAEARQRVIVEATLDGLAVPDDALMNPPDDEYPDSELRFVSDEPLELVRRTLGQVAESLDGTKKQQALAAELIQTGKLDDAMQSLSVSLNSWTQVQQVVTNGVLLLGLSLDDLKVNQTPVSRSVDALAGHLGELKRAIGAQDWSGLADALAFDMQEQADSWKRVLNGLSDVISQSPSRPGRKP